MKKLRKAILLGLGLLPMMMPIDAATSSADFIKDSDELSSSEPQWKKSRLSLEAQSGSRSIGSVDLMVPFMGDNDFLVYTNLKAKFGTGANNSNGSTLEGNLGFGVRRVNDAETAIYGAYAFYDRLKSVNDNTFQQITIGAERLGLTWDFRANAYLPVGTTSYKNEIIKDVVIDNHNLLEFYKASSEKAVAGGDIEIGRTLGSQKLRGYFAVYSFGQDLTGPRMRLDYKLSNHFSLTASVQYDKSRSVQYLAGMRISIGGVNVKKSDSIYNRLTDEVVRDIDIATIETSQELLKTKFDKFWVVDLDSGSGGAGTIDNPFGQISDAVQDAPENAIIFVKGSTAETINLNSIVNMKDGQILWGGYKPLHWDFANGQPSFGDNENTLLLQDGAGIRQSIAGSIEAANNAGIYGFDISADKLGQNQHGILVDNKTNVILSDVNITGFQSGVADKHYAGLRVIGDSSITIKNVALSNNDIGLRADGSNLYIENLNVSNNLLQGINASNNASINADSISVTGSGAEGVLLNNSQMNSNSISVTDSGTTGIVLNNSQLIAETVSSQHNQDQGVAFFDSNVTITDSLTSSHNKSAGLKVSDSTVMINNVNLTHNKNGAVINKLSDVTVNNAVITNNWKYGLDLAAGTATFNNALFANNGQTEDERLAITDINDLYSAIHIGSDARAVFNANALTVRDNAAGIEVLSGEVNVNNDAGSYSDNQRSLIDGNTGYGVYIHQKGDADSAVVNINNTDIINTKQLSSHSTDIKSGHGIYNQRTTSLNLNNVNISYNTGTGIWHRGGHLTGVSITLDGNGGENDTDYNTDVNLNNYAYGMRVDELEYATEVDLSAVNILNSTVHGLLMTGGDVSFDNLTSSNNQDGIMYVNGKLKVTNSLLLENNRFGVYINYMKEYASTQTDNQLELNKTQIKNTKNMNEDFYARGSGHGIAIDSMFAPTENKIILDTTIIDNNQGIGIYIAKDVLLDITNSTISHNGSSNARLVGVGGHESGGVTAGGIYKEYRNGGYSLINLNSSFVHENYGGGVIVWADTSDKPNHILNIDNTIIQENKGVGVRMDRGYISNSTITNNEQQSHFWSHKDWSFSQAKYVTRQPDINWDNSGIDYRSIYNGVGTVH